jgi:hypothetical protein
MVEMAEAGGERELLFTNERRSFFHLLFFFSLFDRASVHSLQYT